MELIKNCRECKHFDSQKSICELTMIECWAHHFEKWEPSKVCFTNSYIWEDVFKD